MTVGESARLTNKKNPANDSFHLCCFANSDRTIKKYARNQLNADKKTRYKLLVWIDCVGRAVILLFCSPIPNHLSDSFKHSSIKPFFRIYPTKPSDFLALNEIIHLWSRVNRAVTTNGDLLKFLPFIDVPPDWNKTIQKIYHW